MDPAVRAAALLEGIDPAAAEALGAYLEAADFPSGRVIFSQGEPGDRLFIITSGKVKIGYRSHGRRDNLLAVLGPSDLVGELAVFDPGPRGSSATAMTAVRAASMDRNGFRHCLTGRPDVAEHFLRVMARRHRRANDYLSDLIFTDGAGRVAKTLLDLARRFGVPEKGAIRVPLDLTHEETAQLVGSARGLVDEAFSEFTRCGWIRWHADTVWIVEAERLAGRARQTR